MKLKRKNKLIPRFSLPAYHRKKVNSSTVTSPFANQAKEWEFYMEEAIYCTLQTVSKNNLNIDLTGLKSEELFTLRTQTPMHEAEEGTGFIGSGIYIPDSYFLNTSSVIDIPSKGGWYNVISSIYWGNGIFPHYQCIIKKDTSAKDEEYPITQRDLCVDLWSTRSLFLKSSNWSDIWIGQDIIDAANDLHEELLEISEGDDTWEKEY